MEPEGSLPHSQDPATCPYSEPDQPSPKSHVPFLFLMLYQRISPTPKQLWMYGIMAIFLRWRVLSTSPNPQAGWPPLVGCPRPLIQYVRSYPPYWMGIIGIGTRYGLDGPGINYRLGRDFPHPFRPILRPTQPPVQWVSGLCPGDKSARSVALTAHPLLVSRLRVSKGQYSSMCLHGLV
jgi:hypothetical protein